MKKSLIYILAGAAVVGVIAYFYATADRKRKREVDAQQQAAAATGVLPKFKGFNSGLLLNTSSRQAVAEVTALQMMINAYYNGARTVGVTGIFDAQTKEAVKDIIGKNSTTLNEFRFQYLIKERGERVADDIFRSITQTGK